MSFAKTKEIKVFDETWCPVGTCVQITQLDKWRYAVSGCLEKPIMGIVTGYKSDGTVMIVHTIGLIQDIDINLVGSKYEIRRLVPEYDDTMDMNAFTIKPEFAEFINKKPDKYWKPFIDLYNELEQFGTVNVSLYELYELWKQFVLKTECDNNLERYYFREIFNGVRLPEEDDINNFAVWLSEQ